MEGARIEMAGEETPKTKDGINEKRKEQKKKGKFALPVPACLKGMTDGLVIVLAPFVIFVLLFLYVMGFIPPQPVVIEVAGTASAGPDSAGTAQDLPVDRSPTGPADYTEALVAPEAPGAAAAQDAEDGVMTAAAQSETVYVEPAGLTAEAAQSGAAESREKKIKQLAKVYERMNASSVASIVTNMSDQDAVEILSRMNPRNAAKVLAALDPEKAAEFSLLLTQAED
jgi:hypothetical protein